MTPDERNGFHLTLILEAIDDLKRRLANTDMARFLADRDEQALTAFRLSIIGENCNKLTDGLKARRPSLPWRNIYAFRNVVTHEYHRVDPELSWAAVEQLGAIEDMARFELKRLAQR